MMEPGALCWFELATTDPESAGAFYKSVLQVDIDRDENVEEFPYWVLKVGDQMVGGIIQIGEDWGPVPPNWASISGSTTWTGSPARQKTWVAASSWNPGI